MSIKPTSQQAKNYILS